MSWVSLIVAGIFEMLGVVMINKVNRERSARAVVLLLVFFGASFLFLTLAMTTLEMSTAYAVWTGIGTTGAAILGMVLYKEPADLKRIAFIALILGASIGLKLVS